MADYRRQFDDESRNRNRGWSARGQDEARSWFGEDASRQRRGNDERDDQHPYGGDRDGRDNDGFGSGWSGRFRYPHGTDADEYDRAAREQRDDFNRWSARSPGAERPNYSGRPDSHERPNYYGRGPKDYRRSDERIREEIADRMTDDWTLDASDISVAVKDGEVTLSGTVASREQKRRAEDVADRVSGVRDVSNQLRVSRAWAGSTQDTPGNSTSGTTT